MPITASQLAPLIDVVFATHHHADHCNVPTIGTLAREGSPTRCCLGPASSEWRKRASRRRVWSFPGPEHSFDVRGFRVEPTHAIHGNQEFTVLTREPDFIESITHNCGYVLNIRGKRLFHPGDSVLTEEHLKLEDIDVLFVSPTVHNMYIDRSMILINRLEPDYIFPQHFGTYRQTEENAFWTRGYPDELKQRLSRELQERYHKLRQGELFVIPEEGGRLPVLLFEPSPHLGDESLEAWVAAGRPQVRLPSMPSCPTSTASSGAWPSGASAGATRPSRPPLAYRRPSTSTASSVNSPGLLSIASSRPSGRSRHQARASSIVQPVRRSRSISSARAAPSGGRSSGRFSRQRRINASRPGSIASPTHRRRRLRARPSGASSTPRPPNGR